jgi:guanylate kinase
MKKLILLVGPTCSGKSTLEKELNSLGVPSVISYTTRALRTGETNGVDYYFVSHEQAKAYEEAGLTIQKVEFSGYSYGSTVGSLNEAFRNSEVAVMVVEPTGVAQFQEVAKRLGWFKVVSLYVHGEWTTLCDRLIARYNADKNARDEYYWQRFMQMSQAYREWPTYIAYTDRIASIDDRDPWRSTHSWALRILDTHCR